MSKSVVVVDGDDSPHFRMGDRLKDIIITAVVSGFVVFLGALGFSSPKATFDDHERRIRSVEVAVGDLKATVNRVDQKADDLIDGLGIQRKRSAKSGPP